MKKTKKHIYSIFLIILLIIAILAVLYALWKIYKPNKIINNNLIINASSSKDLNISNYEEKTFSDKNNFYEITAKYPSDSLDKERDIETFILYKIKEKQNEWKVGGEIYNSEQEVIKDFPDRPKMIYSYDISYNRYESKEKGTVSYVFNTYEFTGGAHGINVVNTFTFDNKGKINIEDILDFSNGNGVKLSKILAKKIIAEGDEMINEDMLMTGLGITYLKSDGSIDKEKCNCDGFYIGSNFQNFYINDTGITFLFGQYQVAPGAAGTVSVNIDWETLKPYLIK